MKPRSRTAFTLVELLVVITIIGILAALLLPAINHARESARQIQCMNNQRSIGKAIQDFATAKDYFPGYRNVFNLTADTSNPNPKVVVNWQVMLWPYLERTDFYQQLQNQTITSMSNGAFLFPYLEFSVCPSDNTIVSKSAPLTSYVVNTGRLDRVEFFGTNQYSVTLADPPKSEVPPPMPDLAESFANGIFQDRVLTTAKQAITDIKDGPGNTLMLSENVDAGCYTDGPYTGSDSPLLQLNTTDPPAKWPFDWAQQLTTAPYPHNCSERGAGFVWWDTSAVSTGVNPPPVPTGNLTANNKLSALKAQVVVINGRSGDFDPARVGWPSAPNDFSDPYDASVSTATPVNSNFAARPSSNHPGGVNVVFADGRTKFLSDDIDYSVYCLLMTSNGGVSQPSTDSQFDNTETTYNALHAKSWQYYTPVTDGQY